MRIRLTPDSLPIDPRRDTRVVRVTHGGSGWNVLDTVNRRAIGPTCPTRESAREARRDLIADAELCPPKHSQAPIDEAAYQRAGVHYEGGPGYEVDTAPQPVAGR